MLTKVFSVVCVLVVLSSALASADKNVVLQIEDTDNIDNSNGTIRGKRTIGVVLRNVADLFGYDVQKRPTVIPPSTMAPAPAAAPAAPAPAAPAPAAPAPAAPPGMMTGDIMMAPVAMVNRQQMPARIPLLPPAPPLPVLPPPVTFPPILQEQVRKTFNINFNWNKAVGSAQPVAPAKPAAPAQPASPAPPQAASLPEGPIASGPKRPVTKAQLYSSYEYLYPPLGSAPPAPKYVKKKYNYKYGPIKTVTNYNDEPEPSHEVLSNEKESAEDINYDDYNTFVAHEDGTPEEAKKEQYKNNVRNFWKNNHWALQDNGYKYIAPEAQQQQQNFQQDYPKEMLTVKESNYYKPLQPLKKVQFQDYYVTQAVQPKKAPAQPLPTQDISQFKKYYVQSSVPKLDLPAKPQQQQQQQQQAGITTQDGKQISQQDLKNIVQQLVQLTQQAKQQQHTPTTTQATPRQPEVLSKYEEYTIPSSHEYKDYSIPSSKEYHIPSSKEYGLPTSNEEFTGPTSQEEVSGPSKEEEEELGVPASKEIVGPTSTERAYVNPKNPRQKKLEKEKALVKKKEFNNAYKEEKHEPTVVEHDYNILNTVTGNEIPYDERKFEEFKYKHGYAAPEDAELPKPDSSGEVKEEEKKEEEEVGNKEPLDDDYVANIRKPQGKPTEENIETTADKKAKVVNVKEPIYDSYNDYEEQNDAPALPPQLHIGDENAEEEEEYDEEDDGEEEKQNVAEEEDGDDDDDDEERERTPQRAQYYYPEANKALAQKAEEVESRINEKVKKIISVDAKPVETDVVPTPTYQYFTFRNRRILSVDDQQDSASEPQAVKTTTTLSFVEPQTSASDQQTARTTTSLSFDEPQDSASDQQAAKTTISPDYVDFGYVPGSTLIRAEKEKAIRDKKREEGEEVDEEDEERERKFQGYKPSPFVTEKIPDFEEVKKAIKKSGRSKDRPKKRARRREDKKKRRPHHHGHQEQEVSATTPELQFTDANVFTYAPTNPFPDITERVVEETKEIITQRSRDRDDSKKNDKKGDKYVELSEFLERYDDFDYLRQLDRLKSAAADSSEEKDKEKEKEPEKPAEGAESKRNIYRSSWDSPKRKDTEKPAEEAESKRSTYKSSWDSPKQKEKSKDEAESKRNIYKSSWDAPKQEEEGEEGESTEKPELKGKTYKSSWSSSKQKETPKEDKEEDEESTRNIYKSSWDTPKRKEKAKEDKEDESTRNIYKSSWDTPKRKEKSKEEDDSKRNIFKSSWDSPKPKEKSKDEAESKRSDYKSPWDSPKQEEEDEEEEATEKPIGFTSIWDKPKQRDRTDAETRRKIYRSIWDSPKAEEIAKIAEAAESKQQIYKSIWDNPKQDPQKAHVREIRSKNSKKQKEEEEEEEEENEETATEAGKFFDNYQIFKDFFNTKTDSHEDDEEEEEESEEETKTEKAGLGYPGFAKAYEEFDYTKKPDFLAETTTAAPKQKKDDNKEKKGSSSENHDRYDYYHQPFEQEGKKDDGKEKEPQEAKEKQKVDNPYSIPTIFDISHYTNPEIPEIPDFILEEERREEELAKMKEAIEQQKPTIRRVKKPRKHPGGPRPGIPAAKIVPINVATTNKKAKSVPNPAYKPIGGGTRNSVAGTQKIETLYSGLQPNQLHELSKVDKTLPLTIPFDYDYSGTEVVQRAVVARRRRRRDVSTREIETFTYLPSAYDRDFSYTIPEPAAQTNYEQYERKEHGDDGPLSHKAKVVTTEVGKLKGHIDVAAF